MDARPTSTGFRVQGLGLPTVDNNHKVLVSSHNLKGLVILQAPVLYGFGLWVERSCDIRAISLEYNVNKSGVTGTALHLWSTTL